MTDPLRPISVRELLFRTFSLYRHHFMLFLGVSIIGPVALFAYRLRFGGGMGAIAGLHSSSTALPVVIGILMGIMIMLAGVATSSAAAVKAVAAINGGSEVRVAEGFRALAGRLWRILGIVASVFIRAFPGGFLFVLAGIPGLALAAHLGYNAREEAKTIGYVCGGGSLAAALFAGIWICARYAVAVQACVVENISRKLSLRRSQFLIAGDRGRIVLLHFAFLILFLLTEFVLGAPALLLPTHGATFRISEAVASLIAGAIAAPVATIGMSLVYFDERVRKETYDSGAMTDAVEAPVEQAADVRV